MPGIVQCSTVVVPLDRTGQVPGTISLHVEVVPAQGTPRGAIFLIAGGPGQGSAHVFSLDDASAVSNYRVPVPRLHARRLRRPRHRRVGTDRLPGRPGRDHAGAEPRGRRRLRRADRPGARLLLHRRACRGSRGGPRRARVRQDRALRRLVRDEARAGVRARPPDHVERLLLDSVVPPERPDPYGADDLRAHACHPGRVLLGRKLPRGDEQLQR